MDPLWPYYLHNGISYSGKMTFLYWISPFLFSTIFVVNTAILVRLPLSRFWVCWDGEESNWPSEIRLHIGPFLNTTGIRGNGLITMVTQHPPSTSLHFLCIILIQYWLIIGQSPMYLRNWTWSFCKRKFDIGNFISYKFSNPNKISDMLIHLPYYSVWFSKI